MKNRDRLYGVLLVGIEGVGKTRLSKQLALVRSVAVDADDMVPVGSTSRACVAIMITRAWHAASDWSPTLA